MLGRKLVRSQANRSFHQLTCHSGAYNAVIVCYGQPGNEAFVRPPGWTGARESALHFHRGKHGDLIRSSWHIENGRPDFDTDDEAESRGRRVGADVLGAKALLQKLQAIANLAAV